MRLFLPLLLITGCTLSAFAQESFPELRKAAEGEFQAVGSSYKTDLQKLKDNLLGALAKARDSAKKDGDLDRVTAFDAEIARWKDEGDLAIVASENPEIARLNVVYEKAAAALLVKRHRAVVAWFRAYDGRLTGLEKELVSQDKIKEAGEVRSERDARRESMTLHEAQEAVKLADAAAKDARTENPATAPAKPWSSLTEEKWKKAEGSTHFTRNLKKPDGRVAFNGQKLKPKDYLFAHARGRLEYEFEKPITEFRATICLADHTLEANANQSGVYFSVVADEGEVFRSKLISATNTNEEVEISFKPSKKLVLITDDNKDDRGDWSIWVKPEYR